MADLAPRVAIRLACASIPALLQAEAWARGMERAEQLEAAILALESQRGNLGDAVVDTAVAPMRTELAALRAAGSAPLRVRQITVLFADIVGSTAIGERLDAEDIVEVMSTALARFGAVVEAHGGRVARFTGDGLKGIFGADTTEENAPERAVRAGLEILAEAQRYAATLRETQQVEAFQVRVGINTGAVALGGGVEADNTAMGTAVNLAARMEQAAPPGGLLISQDTYALVRGLFDAGEQAPITVKGHAAPLATWLVRRVRPREFRAANRGIAGLETKMVGRDVELGRLLEAHREVTGQGALRAVTVLGDAGVGKSRLLHELRRQLAALAPGGVVLLARADPQMRLQPYRLLRELLAARLRIAEQDSAEVARDKLRAGLVPPLSDGEAELLGHLIGIEFSATARVAAGAHTDARLLRDRGFRASLRWLGALAATAPLVVLLDDLHWADQGSLDWIQHLIRAGAQTPLLLVMLARPALLEGQPDWFGADMAHPRIDVAPLGARSSDDLVDELLQRLGAAPPELRALLTDGAEGNPFYMEELVRMLIDDGVIVAGPDADWHVVADKLRAARVPPTLTAVLQARIDALGHVDRTALQQASVIGPVFWDAALDAVAGEASASIPALLNRQMSVPREESAFADCHEYAFTHHLLHQATYDTVLKPMRRAGHARAGAWLSARVHDRSGEYLAATAEHFERAGDRAQAARYFARAATEAAARYANAAALEHVRRALDNLDADDVEARFAALMQREIVFDTLGERTAQRACLDELVALVPAGSDPRREADVTLRRALLADRCGDFAQAGTLACAALELAAAQSMWTTAARAAGEYAYVLMRTGDNAGAREQARIAHEHATRSGEMLPQAQILAISGTIESAAGADLRALDYHHRALELARAAGHLRLEGLLEGNTCGSLTELGQYEEARLHGEAAAKIAREIGNRSVEGNALVDLSQVMLALGDPVDALDKAQRAVEIHRALDDRFHCAQAQLCHGEALVANGRLDDAVGAYADAGTLYDRIALAGGRLEADARSARVALLRGDVATALTLVQPVLAASAAMLSVGLDPNRVRGIAWRVLVAAGDGRAASWLATAHEELQAQARGLEDAGARDRFLAISWHREICDAWAEAGH
jgi:class 3 adenylate cyclase/tetratricopeptide (TPR) repeat protein